MRRLPAASALLALALLTAAATGQPPTPKELPRPAQKDNPEAKPANPPDRTEAAIAAALANDPDVKMARAKIQLAEAELAKARLTATLRVMAVQTRVEQARADARGAEAALAQIMKLYAEKVVSVNELDAPRNKFEVAKAALAAAEAEWKLLTGGDAGPLGRGPDTAALAWVALPTIDGHGLDGFDKGVPLDAYLGIVGAALARPTVKGPVSDLLRAALDKPVKLAPKGEVVTFQRAMEVFKKEAGLDVIARGEPLAWRPRVDPATGRERIDPEGKVMMDRPEIVSEGETLPVGAWFQVFQDAGGFVFYVREYGLLAAIKQAAPPDAPTLTEFWKQKPPTPRPEAKIELPVPKSK